MYNSTNQNLKKTGGSPIRLYFYLIFFVNYSEAINLSNLYILSVL